MIEKLRMSRMISGVRKPLSGVRGRPRYQSGPAAARIIGGRRRRCRSSVGSRAVAADYRAVQQQNRDVQPVPARQLGIRVDVHQLKRGQRRGAPEHLQLRQHLLAKTAVLAVKKGESRHGPSRRQRRPALGLEERPGGGGGAERGPAVGAWDWPGDRNALAMRLDRFGRRLAQRRGLPALHHSGERGRGSELGGVTEAESRWRRPAAGGRAARRLVRRPAGPARRTCWASAGKPKST